MALGRLLAWRGRTAQVLRLVAIALPAAYGFLFLARLALTLAGLARPWQARPSRDIMQDYLLGRAIVDGAEPYQPIGELARRYLGLEVPTPFPSPHPPPLALAMLPLAALPFPAAALIWCALEFGFLLAASYLLLRTANLRRPLLWALPLGAVLLGWSPVREDLFQGQVSLLLLLLLGGARLALRSSRPLLGGGLVGLAVLVKLFPWPLLLILALRREWRALGASLATLLLGYAVAGAVIGPGRVVAYFTEHLPSVGALMQREAYNLSLWTVGRRLFVGTGPGLLHSGITAAPLIRSDIAHLIVTPALPALVLLGTCLVAWRHPSLDAAFGVMICASILIDPIVWLHDLLLALIPAACAAEWLARRRFPARVTSMALVIPAALAAVPSYRMLDGVVRALAGQPYTGSSGPILPFAPPLLYFVPMLAPWALAHLLGLLRTDPTTPPAETPRNTTPGRPWTT